MAYETIGRYDVYDYTHESGGFNIRIEAVAKQEMFTKTVRDKDGRLIGTGNTSNFYLELLAHFTSTNASFSLSSNKSDITFLSNVHGNSNVNSGERKDFTQTNISEGEEVTQTLAVLDSTHINPYYSSSNSPKIKNTPHNLDGSFPYYDGVPMVVFSPANHGVDTIRELAFYFHTWFRVWNIEVGGTEYDSFYIERYENLSKKITLEPKGYVRGVDFELASNFTDEGEPSFSCALATDTIGNCLIWYDTSGIDSNHFYELEDKILSLDIALSFDGVTPDIPYRSIPIDTTYYTFDLTEAEREILRTKSRNSTTTPIYYLLKVTRAPGRGDASSSYYRTAEIVTNIQKTLTIIGCYPSVNPQLRDVNSDTVALTGDEKKFIRYESMAEFSTGAVASKHAEIVSQFVQCGSKTVYDSFYGVIDDVESGTFVFNVVDSRNLQSSTSVFADIVDYVKPTCKQNVKINITATDDADAEITLKVSGAYFGGSFGVVDNTLLLEVRHTDDSGTMGDWEVLDNPTINVSGNTYELTKTYGNVRSDRNYVFQCRATDKLNYVETAQYTVTSSSVFDWGEEDFNFNVPINMHGKTIIRHNKEANNTVLSASGGHIYIRPGGTDNTSGEVIIYPDGKVKFNNEVEFADGSTGGGGSTDADYVIETGEESMGSNGTWYWRKWNSGKSEAWGCRNFGNMAVTTAWGNLYRSAVLTQNLPSKVFIRTPDSININIVHATFGGWICKHEQTAPSAATTGSFIFVRPASATVTAPTNIGFHIIGEWK